jgi:hypothetical protein
VSDERHCETLLAEAPLNRYLDLERTPPEWLEAAELATGLSPTLHEAKGQLNLFNL